MAIKPTAQMMAWRLCMLAAATFLWMPSSHLQPRIWSTISGRNRMMIVRHSAQIQEASRERKQASKRLNGSLKRGLSDRLYRHVVRVAASGTWCVQGRVMAILSSRLAMRLRSPAIIIPYTFTYTITRVHVCNCIHPIIVYIGTQPDSSVRALTLLSHFSTPMRFAHRIRW